MAIVRVAALARVGHLAAIGENVGRRVRSVCGAAGAFFAQATHPAFDFITEACSIFNLGASPKAD